MTKQKTTAAASAASEQIDTDAIPESISEEQVRVQPTVQSSSTATVIVASNFPHALKFKIQVGGGKPPATVEIKGNATGLRGKAKGVLPVGAYGLTPLDAQLWDLIKVQYAHFPAIKNGLIFVTKKTQYKEAVKERTGLRNGFEPVDTASTETEPTKK